MRGYSRTVLFVYYTLASGKIVYKADMWHCGSVYKTMFIHYLLCCFLLDGTVWCTLQCCFWVVMSICCTLQYFFSIHICAAPHTSVLPQGTSVLPQGTSVLPQDTSVLPQDTCVPPQTQLYRPRHIFPVPSHICTPQATSVLVRPHLY